MLRFRHSGFMDLGVGSGAFMLGFGLPALRPEAFSKRRQAKVIGSTLWNTHNIYIYMCVCICIDQHL